MNKSAFEISKNDKKTNNDDWLRGMPLIQYGKVEKVVDINTAVVTTVVQDSLSPKRYVVRILHDVSQEKEEAVKPKKYDLVLLLFIRGYKDEMFLDPEEREKVTEDATIYADDGDNYNMFSGIGILLSTVKGRSYTTKIYDEDADGPTIKERTVARVTAEFNKAMSVLFDVPLNGSGGTPDDEKISLTFGKRSPFAIEHHAAVTETYGFDTAKDGTVVEMGSPVTRTYGNKAPVTENIRGAVTVNVGTDHDGASVTAPVDIEMNDKSPLTINSKEGATIEFKKATLVKIGNTYKLEATGAITIKGASITLQTGDAASWMPNCIPVCPFGPPHGGPGGGIVNLKGA